MGESLQGSNRIYCVVRPERPSGARVQRGKSVAIAEDVAYIFYLFYPLLFPDLLLLFAKQNFSVLGFGQRGIKGVNAQNPKLLILLFSFYMN
jgi:hypothetical protein